jgi:hypothetical protein
VPKRRIQPLGKLTAGLLEDNPSGLVAVKNPVSIISEDRTTRVARSSYKIIEHHGDVSIYYCQHCQNSFKVPDDDDMYKFCPYCAFVISDIDAVDDLI